MHAASSSSGGGSNTSSSGASNKTINEVKSYDTVNNEPVHFQSGEKRDPGMSLAKAKAIKALNGAADVLVKNGLDEYIEILQNLTVYLSQDTIGSAKAFVPNPTGRSLVFNMAPLNRTWDLNLTGLGLHEIHHFSRRNIAQYRIWQASGLPESPTRSPHEADAYNFQTELGFPSCLGHVGC